MTSHIVGGPNHSPSEALRSNRAQVSYLATLVYHLVLILLNSTEEMRPVKLNLLCRLIKQAHLDNELNAND